MRTRLFYSPVNKPYDRCAPTKAEVNGILLSRPKRADVVYFTQIAPQAKLIPPHKETLPTRGKAFRKLRYMYKFTWAKIGKRLESMLLQGVERLILFHEVLPTKWLQHLSVVQCAVASLTLLCCQHR